MIPNKNMLKHEEGRVLVVAHRGVSGANIPCNSLTAFQIGLSQGADIIELDVAESADGGLFVFHPGMEKPHLGIDTPLSSLSSEEIQKLRFLNFDDHPTSYPILTLEEALTFLKDKAFINVDKFWRDIEGISRLIRKVGVEDQVIVKTPARDEFIEPMQRFAKDLAYIPTVRENDGFVEKALEAGLNLVGIEAIFATEENELVSDAFIERLHQRGLMIFGNAIIYDETKVISAGHTDDAALAGDPDLGWGWFADKKFDIIQTDWCQMLKHYLASR